MRTNDNQIKRHIKNLRDTITTASLNHDIWWIYKHKDTRSKYIDIMNNYLSFFRTSIHAHFVAMIIALYRLFEKRKDTINIPGLVRLLDKSGYLKGDSKKKVEALVVEGKVIWIKVGIIRSEVFAHSNQDKSIDESFKKANIKYKNFKELVEISKKIMNLLAYEFDKSSHAFNLSAENDTKALLNKLLNGL